MREIDLLVSHSDGEDLGPRLAKLGPAPVRVIRGLAGIAPHAILAADVVACSPADCARLAAEGIDVVMLAAERSADEERAYLNAGAAAYVDMIVDDALLGVLRRLAS